MNIMSPFIWQELVTNDPIRSGEFYSQLFGWHQRHINAGEYGTYTIFQKDGHDIAGMMKPTPDTPGDAPYWHFYIAVENIDYIAEQTVLLGGEVLVAPHNIPDVGRACAISDSTGAIVHLMQSGNKTDDVA